MNIEFYRHGIKLGSACGTNTSYAGNRQKVSTFSESSRRRLDWIYQNGPWQSMLTLTYHEMMPEFEVAKHQLHNFLRYLTRLNIKYLWKMEFQLRGVLHYHVWIDRSYDGFEWHHIILHWLKVSNQDHDYLARAFALHGKSCQSWKIVVGKNYASGYASKREQCTLPLGISRFGRWWGCSRGLKLVLQTEVIDMDHADLNIRQRNRKFYSVLKRSVRKYIERVYKFKFSSQNNLQRGIRFTMPEIRVNDIRRIYNYMLDSVYDFKYISDVPEAHRPKPLKGVLHDLSQSN